MVNLSCASKPTDLRGLVPADTLVYLETNDLAAALQPIIDSKPFNEVAKSKPDFSALKGVQLAVAVTGFETTEEKLSEEHSVGRVQPRFVAVADTHAWDYQAVDFAETRIDSFVQEMLGGDAKMGRSQKSRETGGTYITWGGSDGRLAHALILDGLIYFGNDESAIDKCLAVRRGEADSIAKTGKIQPVAPGTLASGYVSTDGIAQIASIVGLKFASDASDDGEVQSAIADILPQLIRNSITEISWTATKTENGIEDKYLVIMPSDLANVFSETMVPGDELDLGLLNFLPNKFQTATVYNLRNPQVAWRSVLLTAQKQTDPLAGKIIAEVSRDLFEPYGIHDPEPFLSSSKTTLVTASCDTDGEKLMVLTRVSGEANAKKSILSDSHRNPGGRGIEGSEYWISEDKQFAAFFDAQTVASGNPECLEVVRRKSLIGQASNDRRDASKPLLDKFSGRTASIITLGYDDKRASQIIETLAYEGHGDAQAVSTYITETRFTKTGIERRTVSDFGFIGWIIAQLAQD